MTPLRGRQTITDTVIRFFKEDDWKYTQVEGKPRLRVRFGGKNGNWVVLADCRDELDRVFFYSILDMNVPEGKRAAVAEYLTRANYGLQIGNFELDFNDGEVRFKTSVDVEGGELTTVMVKTLLYTNVIMMDKYLTGLMSVVYGGATPAAAVAEAEK